MAICSLGSFCLAHVSSFHFKAFHFQNRIIGTTIHATASCGFEAGLEVPACASLGVDSKTRFRKVPEFWCGCTGRFRCLATLSGAAMWLFWTLFGDNIAHIGRITAQKKWRSCSQTWHKDCAAAVKTPLKPVKLDLVLNRVEFDVVGNAKFWTERTVLQEVQAVLSY